MIVTNTFVGSPNQMPGLIPGWPNQVVKSDGTSIFWGNCEQFTQVTDQTGATVSNSETKYFSLFWWKVDTTENNVKEPFPLAVVSSYAEFFVYVTANTANQPVTVTFRNNNADAGDGTGCVIPAGYTGMTGATIAVSTPLAGANSDRLDLKVVAPAMTGSITIKMVGLGYYQ